MVRNTLLPRTDEKPEETVIQKPEIVMETRIKKPRSNTRNPGIRLGDGLIYLNLLNISMILVIVFLSPGILRMAITVPYLLFVPGYTILAAVFPGKTEISGLERIVLSVGLSFVIAVLVGIFLNYTWFGIRLEPVMYFMFGFVFLTSVIAWLRRLRLEDSERLNIVLPLAWLNFGKNPGGMALSLVLVFGIIGTASYLGFLAGSPKTGETFSEFYILGQPGKSSGYIQNMTVGEESRVYVGVVNHEGKDILYSIKVLADSFEVTSPEPVLLNDGQSWEGEISFTAVTAGENSKFEFTLYRDNETTVYKNLHLWIDVAE